MSQQEFSQQPNNLNPQTYSDLFHNILNEESTLFIIIGSDAGIFPSSLNKFNTPDGTRYLFIEPDSKFENAAKNYKRAEQNKSFITNESSWREALIELKADHYIYSDRINFLKSIEAATSNDEEYNALSESISNKIIELVRGIKIQNEQLLFLQNRLINIVDLIQPAQFLENKGKGTALILGAGPSLDELIPWIKKHQHQVTIISISRIYQQLSYEGIEPDIIVSVDPQPINYSQSKAFLASKKSIFIHSPYVSPQLLAQWNGSSLYLDEQFPWQHKNNVANIQVMQPTVSHAAVNIAVKMRFDQILLAGIDLCYFNTGQTHSNATTHDAIDKVHEQVTTYKGEKATTGLMMQVGIKNLSDMIKGFEGNVYNLSENAAIVPGIKLNKTPELPNQKCTLPEINKLDNKGKLTHLRFIQKEISKARLKFAELHKLSREAIKLNLDPDKLNSLDKFEKNQVKIDNIENKINNKYKAYIELVRVIIAKDFLALLKQSDRVEKSHAERHQWIGEYYAAYSKGSSLILDAIEATQNNLQARLCEISKPTDLESHIKYWQQKDILGRSCIINQQTLCEYFMAEISLNRNIEESLKLLCIYSIEQIKDIPFNYFNNQTVNSKSLTQTQTDNHLLQMLAKGFKQQLSGDTNAIYTYKSIINHIDLTNKFILGLLNNGYIQAWLTRVTEIDLLYAIELGIQTRSIFDDFDSDNILKSLFLTTLKKQLNYRLPYHLSKSSLAFCNKCAADSDLDGLQTLLDKLSLLYPGNEQLPIKLFISGIISQTKGNTESAIQYYTDLLDHMIPGEIQESEYLKHPLLEALLLQMLTLSNTQECISIYSVLCEVSSKYKPILAKMLAKENMLDEAIHYYQECAVENPSDIETIQALAELYKSTGKAEQAKVAFKLAKKLKQHQ